MANNEHLDQLKKGVVGWNAWRAEFPDTIPDLEGADLMRLTFKGGNLSQANLHRATLAFAEIDGADFRGAKLFRADFLSSTLRSTIFSNADMREANLTDTSLERADLREANLTFANLYDADLTEADFREAIMGWTVFGNNDLSTVIGLEDVIHWGPSTIGINTLFKSQGKIPEAFLRGAGVPDDFITFLPSLVGRAIEFYSSFISYSHHDHEFAQRLQFRMRQENLRVWYAPEDMKGGRKIHEEIFRAIQIHDKLLLVLSEHSMQSEWVITEIRRPQG